MIRRDSRPIALAIPVGLLAVLAVTGGLLLANNRSSKAEDGSRPPAERTAVGEQAYLAALEATAQCARDAGFEAEVVPAPGQRVATIAMTARTDAERHAAQGALLRCRAEHSVQVEASWAAHTAPTSNQQAPAARAMAACMTAAGVPGAGDQVTAEQQRQWFGLNGTEAWGEAERRANAAAATCLLQVEEETWYRP